MVLAQCVGQRWADPSGTLAPQLGKVITLRAEEQALVRGVPAEAIGDHLGGSALPLGWLGWQTGGVASPGAPSQLPSCLSVWLACRSGCQLPALPQRGRSLLLLSWAVSMSLPQLSGVLPAAVWGWAEGPRPAGSGCPGRRGLAWAHKPQRAVAIALHVPVSEQLVCDVSSFPAVCLK